MYECCWSGKSCLLLSTFVDYPPQYLIGCVPNGISQLWFRDFVIMLYVISIIQGIFAYPVPFPSLVVIGE